MNHPVASFRNPVLEFLSVALRKMLMCFALKVGLLLRLASIVKKNFSLYFEFFSLSVSSEMMLR